MTRPIDWRYERKLLAPLRPAVVEALIRQHPAGFREAYPERWVNNVYFDTPGRSAYRATIEGERDRVKTRIRWYGDAQGNAEGRLELKIKRGFLGTKRVFGLPKHQLHLPFDARALQRLLGQAGLPEDVQRHLTPLEPVLINRYRRGYFEAAGGLRLTLDTDLTFSDATSFSLTAARAHSRASLLELKYPPSRIRDAERTSQGFPFRVTKHSKYAIGLELVNG
ncbi:MAG: VTC domain-containing protein [Bacteroidota bacterium]